MRMILTILRAGAYVLCAQRACLRCRRSKTTAVFRPRLRDRGARKRVKGVSHKEKQRAAARDGTPARHQSQKMRTLVLVGGWQLAIEKARTSGPKQSVTLHREARSTLCDAAWHPSRFTAPGHPPRLGHPLTSTLGISTLRPTGATTSIGDLSQRVPRLAPKGKSWTQHDHTLSKVTQEKVKARLAAPTSRPSRATLHFITQVGPPAAVRGSWFAVCG